VSPAIDVTMIVSISLSDSFMHFPPTGFFRPPLLLVIICTIHFFETKYNDFLY